MAVPRGVRVFFRGVPPIFAATPGGSVRASCCGSTSVLTDKTLDSARSTKANVPDRPVTRAEHKFKVASVAGEEVRSARSY